MAINITQSMEVENNQYIDVSKLSAGVYFVKLTTPAQQTFSDKYVKTN